MMNRIVAFVFLSWLVPATMFAQEWVSPMDIPLYLSGNFGELRSNHFHSGIDFKTQGKTGVPVRAVNDGQVSRITVSPYGYGNALYIDHPDGTTSVYGHLDKFIPRIDSVVRDSQYVRESFAVTLFFQPGELPIQKGERIAYSGNTGGSGGPHLHFELRKTDTQEPFDPLPFFKDLIKDTRPPEISGLMFFPQVNRGVINGNAENVVVPLRKNKAGHLTIDRVITGWGEIGVGIKAYDRMNETSNIYGVYEIILKVNGEEIYHSVLDQFSFNDTRYLNTYIDWDQWIDHRSFYMKSFTDPGNRLGVNRSLHRGTVVIDRDKDYIFEYIIRDRYGNTSALDFSIAGVPTSIPVKEPEEPYFLFNKDNEYSGKGVVLSIPRGNLYADTHVEIDTATGSSSFSPLYIVGDRIPLHTYCPLQLEVSNDVFPDQSKYGVVVHRGTDRSWLGGVYEQGKMKVEIRELGTFSIETDTEAPVIQPVNATKWNANNRMVCKVTDDLSGVKSYKGTLDGKFVLFEYDAKTNTLACTYDPERMNKGSQELKLTVTDGAGNSSVFSKNIAF